MTLGPESQKYALRMLYFTKKVIGLKKISKKSYFLYQRVYGITTATVKVGYEYSGCDKNVWHIQTAKLSGHDMANADVGGWNLHVQHKYNFHSGILQKGDGNTVYLKYKPQVDFVFVSFFDLC